MRKRGSAAPARPSKRQSTGDVGSSTGLTPAMREAELAWSDDEAAPPATHERGALSWSPPTSSEELACAVGDARAPRALGGCTRCVFDSDCAAFVPKLHPRVDDWLADGGPGAAEERGGQPFAQFLIDVGIGSRASVRRAGKYMPSAQRRVIYLAAVEAGSPLLGGGGSGAPPAPSLALLAEFVGAWFSLPCRVLDSSPDPSELRWSGGKGGKGGKPKAWGVPAQLETTAALDFFACERERLSDAFAVLAVSTCDLVTPGFAFVFGEADVRRGAGVFSLARYHPGWPRSAAPLAAAASAAYLRRCLLLVAHEIGHLFQLAHCAHWECVMNGANTLDEFDRQPLHLCPADLRKLALAVNHAVGGFDPVARYRRLRGLYEAYGLRDEAGWVERRLGLLGARDGVAARCEQCCEQERD